ncbi:MAG: BON domain-containing protein [Pirellulaceae bacterium]|nr:BON domain-containing protein [Pirellulaceae bacterium]
MLRPRVKRIASGILAKKPTLAGLRPIHFHQSDAATDLICIRTIKPHPIVADVIEHDAERLLRESPYNELHQIRCVRRHGVTVLKGTVDSYFLKQLAQETIRGTNGITKINNNIFVNP